MVGVLRSGSGKGAIGLRADLDALHIHEKSGVAHASKVAGKMHACGHDGHTTMLLGAAAALARDEGLRRDALFHLSARRGERGRRPRDGRGGPVRTVPDARGLRDAQLAAQARGHVRGARRPVDGRVRHLRDRRDRQRARTRRCRTPARIRCSSPRTRSARCRRSSRATCIRSTPASSASRRCTRGDTWNVIPQEVVLRGTVRTFDAGGPGVDRAADARHRRRRAAMFDMTATVRYERRYPATVNARERNAARDRRRRGGGRRRQRRHRSAAEHGQRGFRVHAAGEAGMLRLARRGPRAGHAEHAQPALRFQRRRRSRSARATG